MRLSSDAKVDPDSAVAWQLRQYGWPASGASVTTFGTLVSSCRTSPVGYHFGSSTLGSGGTSLANAERSSSGGPSCGGMPRSGCWSVQYQPSYDEVLIIGAQRFGSIGSFGSSTMSMQPSLAVRMSILAHEMLIAFMIIAPSGISPCRPSHSQSTISGE